MVAKENHDELSLERSFYTSLNVAFEATSRTASEEKATVYFLGNSSLFL
ncbi:hypothetical protein [Bartonella gliris]|nr:hypothetical protein [Bartonella gliris]